MTAREELLRAAVYAAFDARGSDSFRAARERMLDGWYLWPLIEYEHALERARRWRDVRQAAINGAADAIRESYLHQSVAA